MHIFSANWLKKDVYLVYLQGSSLCAPSTYLMKIRTYLVDFSAPKCKYWRLCEEFTKPFDQKNAAYNAKSQNAQHPFLGHI